ncbi:hypothetical protein LEN26_000304 [Aphanomyces euteiches]|nr:hypothetical protein AeMF1_020076 [Aphanomyces euteiches]KAH9163857.1 hypothetical protein LEN26_000304 [Aphanomyces euteiches]KAH9197382.1 hypothetical protein AeNC1_000656 [Aphanomyces euteiches]
MMAQGPTKEDEIKCTEYTSSSAAGAAKRDDEPFEFEGEQFWDASSDATSSPAAIEYWGIAYDNDQVYYFQYDTTKTQWEPPSSMIYSDTNEVLLWDPTEQWFYLYEPKSRSSRWFDHFDMPNTLVNNTRPEDTISQATTEELEHNDESTIDPMPLTSSSFHTEDSPQQPRSDGTSGSSNGDGSDHES